MKRKLQINITTSLNLKFSKTFSIKNLHRIVSEVLSILIFEVLKITHMRRRWGTPQNFFLAFIDELEKQIIIKKTIEVGQ